MNQNNVRRALTKITLPCSSQQQQQQVRTMATGSRGARGHGWLHKYRAGLGGRHLQGRYHNRDNKELASINDQVFAFNETHSNKVSTPTQVYLDIATEGESGGPHRVTIELASAALPNTCRNFVDLCEADNGGYKASKVFKILPQVGLCLGDTTKKNNGKQGKCSPNVANPDDPNAQTFAHEATVISHAEEGIVTMISTGLDKNDSRFLIMTADDAPHLDGKFVAFGRVKEGLDVLKDMVENTYTRKGEPGVDIAIVDCGAL